MVSAGPPKVEVYSEKPGEFGHDNTLVCRVSEFHPPDISITLMKGLEDLGGNQTDLAFRQDWRFHLTKHAAFNPSKGEKYSCKVTHQSVTRDYAWGEW